MRQTRLFVPLAVFVLLASLAPAWAAGPPPILYGSSNTGELFSLDVTTGVGTLIGSLTDGESNGATEIECDPGSSAAPVCHVQRPNGVFFLESFDLATGATSSGVGTGAAFNGLEYIDGVLYATAIEDSQAPSTLRTVTPATGASTVIGATGVGPISGLAYDAASSTLFGIAGGPAPAMLYTIDLATGAATEVGSTGLQAGSLQFGPDGLLYAGTTGRGVAPEDAGPEEHGRAGELYRIDPATGAATFVGASGFGTITGLTLIGNLGPVAEDATFEIAEDAAPGASVGNAVASDPDGDALTFTVTGGNAAGLFALDPATGELTVAAALDHESAAQHVLTYEVADEGTPPVTATATLTVNVLDVNERPVGDDLTIDVPEDTPIGTEVGTVTATDPDDGQTLSFEVTTIGLRVPTGAAPNAALTTVGPFTIDSVTGVVTVASALNHAVLSGLDITVFIRDDGTPELDGGAQLTIDIIDVNEPPVATDASFTTPADAAIGTALGTIAATDPDVGDTLTFAITGGNEANLFTIDPSTGELAVFGSLTAGVEHTLQVTVTDAGDPALSDTARVVVDVTAAIGVGAGGAELPATGANDPLGALVLLAVALTLAGALFTYSHRRYLHPSR